MEREDDRHRPFIDSIDNVAKAVEDSSAFAQCRKLAERYPFLTRRTRCAGYSETRAGSRRNGYQEPATKVGIQSISSRNSLLSASAN